jgi:hypothetical protein
MPSAARPAMPPSPASAPIPGDDPTALAATLREYAAAGVAHVQLVLDPITVESIAALEPVLAALALDGANQDVPTDGGR